MRGHSVVLPDRDSRGVVGASNQANGTGHADHERSGLVGSEIQDRFSVSERDDQQMAPAALLARYECRGEIVPIENREPTPAREVIAKRACIGNRNVQGHRYMMPGLNPVGWPWVSGRERLADSGYASLSVPHCPAAASQSTRVIS